MNCYQIWFNLLDSSQNLAFCESLDAYLGFLKREGLIESYRLTRRKLGFGPPELGEFNVTIEARDLMQLDRAFDRAARRDPEVEKLHAAVYSKITDFRAALYRDFPDPHRHRGG